MFNRVSNNVVIDLLFNLLLSFVALFFLAFVMVNDPKEKEEAAKNDNNILITMRWKMDNDIDLWLKLPDGRMVWYSNRDEPPAHLDVDVVQWRRYHQPDGSEYVIEDSEEIITIRSILEGEYAVNAHYYSAQKVDPEKPVEVEIIVQDVKTGHIVYAGKKEISMKEREVNFVRFTVEQYKDYSGRPKFLIKDIYTDRPTFFINEARQQADTR